VAFYVPYFVEFALAGLSDTTFKPSSVTDLDGGSGTGGPAGVTAASSPD